MSNAERETDWELQVEEAFRAYVADLTFKGQRQKYTNADIHTLVVGNLHRMWWDFARSRVQLPSMIGAINTPHDGVAAEVAQLEREIAARSARLTELRHGTGQINQGDKT